MCFSANMSLGLGVAGMIASAWTFADREERFWVRMARAYAIFHFALMEFIQYFAYPVADQCGYGTNLLLTQLSTYHIALQAFAIMPALATYSSDAQALRKATLIGAGLSSFFILCSFMPRSWQPFGIQPNFIGDMLGCLYKGIYHIGYRISSGLGLLVTHGSLFGLALSGYVWANNQRIATYHFVGAILTLFVPQWIFGVTTGEAAAIYCLFSIPLTVSFAPPFKRFFMGKVT